ncbi:Branched-chain amino acid transport system 2 carrier protein [compost metagenome]
MLVLLSFTLRWWNSASRIVAPVMLVSLLFGILDAVKASNFQHLMPEWTNHLPLAAQGLAWLPPSLLMLVLVAIYDRVFARSQVTAHP